MRKSILTFLLFATTFSFGQKLDFGLSVGTGKSYLFESINKTVNVNYGAPISLITEIKFTPKDKNWGIKLRVHNIESTLKGENWVNKTPLNGYINSITTSLILENEIAKKHFSFGFNFGLGLTKETIQQQQYYSFDKSVQNYTSLSVGAHLTHKISKDFDFQILPTLLWQDPFKTIGYLTGKRNANFAGEDLTMTLNFGLRYRLTK
ncbi:MAG: hypothetical protein QM535_13445 [Limnohabitans sp.]|nr:hypothetical protein [Limnohabitans sp.]